MIAKIIDLEQERETKNAYSSGYEQGRTKGIIQILTLCAFLALAWRIYTTMGICYCPRVF